MLRPTVQSASLSWNKAPFWGLRPDLYYCQTVAGLLMWGALPDERTGLSFQSQSHIATDGQSISKSWCRAPDSLTITVLFLWGALSDGRTGLSFVCSAGPRQCILSLVGVAWHSWQYFTVSDLRLPFLSPPTTRRVTVEVFDPASTRLTLLLLLASFYSSALTV
jgi:hypothetical protein